MFLIGRPGRRCDMVEVRIMGWLLAIGYRLSAIGWPGRHYAACRVTEEARQALQGGKHEQTGIVAVAGTAVRRRGMA